MDGIIRVCREAFMGFFGKPMKNFFSCRLESPIDGADYGYEKCKGKHNGKCIDHVYMIPKGKPSILQALRYKKTIWTRTDAKSHCDSHKGGFDV